MAGLLKQKAVVLPVFGRRMCLTRKEIMRLVLTVPVKLVCLDLVMSLGAGGCAKSIRAFRVVRWFLTCDAILVRTSVLAIVKCLLVLVFFGLSIMIPLVILSWMWLREIRLCRGMVVLFLFMACASCLSVWKADGL